MKDSPLPWGEGVPLPAFSSGGARRVRGRLYWTNGVRYPFPRGPYAIKTCRPYGSGKWCARQLRNSDSKTQCGTQDALEKVPDTVLPIATSGH